MKKKLPLLLGCMLIVLSGCSRDKYMPNAGATPEVIFKEACAKCHSPVNGKVMALSPEMANVDAIIERVRNGKGFAMPAFPNLMGDSVEGLAQYVLENSATK
ncbi:c-type cytochrome [Nitrosomonas communis]|uniref:c-type cytochrome n=1 Tax=Nitrosomonas communis TaxID=44574 RepID=UPI0026F0BD51|nr:c-type cytochrome [Nitrosomonas communis]MCO6426650.1 c-type cytochrome [Nitrosomonas communis]